MTKAKYIALTLVAKEVTWLFLLFTELGLLQPNQQHALVKVFKNNNSAHAIHQDWEFKQGGEYESESRGNKHPIIIPLKGNNQGSIALVHTLVFHSRMKHIDI